MVPQETHNQAIYHSHGLFCPSAHSYFKSLCQSDAIDLFLDRNICSFEWRLRKTSRIKNWHFDPFLDDTMGIIHAGTRVGVSFEEDPSDASARQDLPWRREHIGHYPIVLPHALITRRIIREIHQQQSCSSSNLTMWTFNTSFLTTKQYQYTKEVINKDCLLCYKHRKRDKNISSHLGNIPRDRLPLRPFRKVFSTTV